MASPLSPLDPRGSDPAALAVADAGEFLPDPGGWTRHLGWRALAAAGGCLAALWFWPMGETVRAPGVVRPSGENSVVQSSLPGRLASVAVKPDQVVAAGQVLARLDTAALADERRQRLAEIALLDQQLGQARSERQALLDQLAGQRGLQGALLAAGRAAEEQSQAAHAFEEREYARYRSLAASGAVTRSLLDEKDARRRVSFSEVLQARQAIREQEARGLQDMARLRQAASQVETAARELDRQLASQRTRLLEVDRSLADSQIRSPLAGTVVSTALRHPRQLVQAGQEIATIAPSGRPLLIKLQVEGRSISRLRPGLPAQVRVAACPVPDNGVLAARVVSVSADLVGEGAYGVTLAPQTSVLQGREGPCRLRPGMAVQADVTIRRTRVLPWLLRTWRVLG